MSLQRFCEKTANSHDTLAGHITGANEDLSQNTVVKHEPLRRHKISRMGIKKASVFPEPVVA